MSKSLIAKFNFIPCPLNQLYHPVFNRKAKRCILTKSKKGREAKKMIKMSALLPRVKPLVGDISLHIDILKTGRDIDIDAIMKNLLDSLEDVFYTNDKQIVELIVRKHRGALKDEVVVKATELQ